ncbi:PAS domain-containing protein [Bacillus sp. FSL K6-3431]|uniref:PAS domain-containing protein n=1 Tax=Bacillus sp. FSL K6-3431 TaxID=2921500 RepID=UPI0030FB62BB
MREIMNSDQMKQALLHESLSMFAKTTKEILILLDSQGKIKYINASLEKELQYHLFELENKSYLDLVHEDDRNKTRELMYAFRNNQFFSPYTNRYYKKDGTCTKLFWRYGNVTKEGWVQVIGRLVEGSTDKLENCITNSDGLNVFFDMTDEAGDICDLQGRVILLNTAFENLYGWKREEIVGKTLPIFPKHLQHELQSVKTELLSGKKIVHFQTFRMKKDGSIFPVTLIASPIIDENGEIIALSAITKDLTELMEKKRMIEKQNEMIAEQEELLLYLSENITEVICLFDITQCKFLYISPSLEPLWGISVEKLYENPKAMMDKIYPEDLKKMKDVFSSTNSSTLEIEYRIKDDNAVEEKWVRTKITPIINKSGYATQSISVSQDITEWKKQDEILKKQDKLGVMGQLAAGIAHEIRNPLTTIKGLTQLRAQESKDTYDGVILKELERIESIVTEFLMLANPHQKLKFENENLNDILVEVIHFMQPEALLNKVKMITILQNTMPNVRCEPKQIKQVLINVIKNAIEAMPAGGTITFTTALLPSGLVAIEIKDEGIGIPKEMIGRLGEPFYSNKERGTGLGLMVSLKIIENHHGTILFDSEDGGGTAVRISLLASNQIK